jgi:hypothetical protein
MKLGAEPKKVIILVTLLVVALVLFVMNSDSSPDTAAAPPSAATPAPSAGSNVPAGAATSPSGAAAQTRGRTSTEFKPRVGARRGEQRSDPMSIDPTLRLDVLAKLQTVTVEGPHRSIFDFSQPPAPKPDPAKAAAAKVPVPSPIAPVKPVETAQGSTEPGKPVAPPIPLKFYGYVSPAGVPQKRAFFMDGEEIHVVHEGELVKKRYKIVRIGVNSVVIEDTQFGSQQTLPLEEQQSS